MERFIYKFKSSSISITCRGIYACSLQREIMFVFVSFKQDILTINMQSNCSPLLGKVELELIFPNDMKNIVSVRLIPNNIQNSVLLAQIVGVAFKR